MLNREALAQPRLNSSKCLRVLIADPDEPLQAVYRETLTQGGFEVTAAFSGLECVARLRECVPDVLVLEPQLLWGGGDGVLSVIGEVPALATIPVIVLTSCRDSRVLNRVSRFPISDYQIKPLPPDRLAAKLCALVTHPRLHFSLLEQTDHIECSIARRTSDRVRNLHVETVDGRVIVRGRCDSHHVKQLARPPCWRRLKPRNPNAIGSSWLLTFVE